MQEDFFAVAETSTDGPSRVDVSFIVYSFNGANGRTNNFLTIPDPLKTTFLETTDQFSLSFWLRVETESGASYLVSFELGNNRLFSLYEISRSRLVFYYYRDALPGFSSATDDGYNTQVALSYFYNRTQLPNGLRDNNWHFISFNIQFPSATLVIDGVQYQPTRGNFDNQFRSQVSLDQTPGVNYTMPAPISRKSPTEIAQTVGRIGGSIRSNNFATFGEMRQLFLTSVIDDNLYACLASCNNLIGVDPAASGIPNLVTFYNPVTRTFDFTGPTNAAGYTDVLQSLVYYTNGFLLPEESGESRIITLRINDELGLGSEAQINLIGRSNQHDPLLDINGDVVPGIDFMLNLREDVSEDQQLQILSPRSFITDDDINSRIVSVTVNLTNSRDELEENIILVDNPPILVNVTDGNGRFLGPNDASTVILIESIDPVRATANIFLTALLNLRYSNFAEEPGDMDRIIEYTVFDGLRTNNPRARTIIDILITDDVPIIDLNGGGGGRNNIVRYVESSPPTSLISDLLITDPDSLLFTGANVRIETVFDDQNETLAFDQTLVALVGLSCIPASCNGTNVSLVGGASLPNYQRVLRTLQYVNLKQLTDLPNLRDRTVFVRVSDGNNFSNEDANVLIDFIPLNPRIIVELAAPLQNYSTTFTEAQEEPIFCHSLVRVVDSSIDTLESIVVSIRNVLPEGVTEDQEMITITGTDDLSISIEINTALKRITFSQVSDISQYLEAIRRVQYFNGEPEPYLIQRFVDFVVIPGGGAPSDTAECSVTILSINDHTPECPALSPVLVSENSTDGLSIVRLEATDQDRGRDGELGYQLIEGDASLFQVSADGEVTLSGEFPLNREAVPEHMLVVEACDGGSPQECCQFNVTILVQDINDNPPIFNSTAYAFQISENEIRDFATINDITDADEGSNAQISTVEIDSDSFSTRTGCFGLLAVRTDSDNGIILSSVAPGLDFEVTSTCRFDVVVNDGGEPALSGRATVTVSVLNVDDFPPEFSQDSYTFSVEEENVFPLVVGMVAARDRDSPSITFSQVGSIGQFEVNATTGAVSILFSSNRTVQTVYTFTAEVRDPPGLLDTAMVTVEVRAINNDPPVLDLNLTDTTSSDALSPFLFVEEGDAVRILTEPSLSDPDELELTITDITIRVANSGNPESEVLSLAADAPPHIILPSTSATLRIQPQNPNNISEILALIQSVTYANTEDELSECNSNLFPCVFGPLSRTLLFTVFDERFTSNEPAAFVTFELVNDPPVVDLDDSAPGQGFRTEFREGTSSVDIVNLASYSISDEDSTNFLSLTCNLTNPLDDTEESLILRDNLPSGVSNVVTDPHLIQLTGNAPATVFETALGLIAYQSTSNNPDATDRVIEVFVTDDSAQLSNVAIATITFNTTNDPPRLDLDAETPGNEFAVTYIENSLPISLSGTPAITDVDSKNIQRLDVTLMGASGEAEVLSWDQGLVAANALSAVYMFPQLTVTGSATLNVYRDIVGSVGYQSTADEFANVADRTAVFTITDTEGGAGNSSTTISIETVDDNPPVFVPTNIYNFTIAENSARGSLVDVITVTDADLPPEQDIPIFAIVAANPSEGFSDFVIVNNANNAFQGLVRVNGEINFEHIPRYDLTVLAVTATRNATASVAISIINLPDIPPMFDQCPPVFTTFENEPFNTPLSPASCTAVDPDGLDDIRYSIEGDFNTLINIDPATGVLRVVDTINREVVGVMFDATITASDSEQRTARNISVVIQGVNEHDPVFNEQIYSVDIEENSKPSPTPIIQVTATDADERPDLMADPMFVTRITYSIDSPGSEQFFSINATTGEITQLQAVDFEQTPLFQLSVVANDNDASVIPRQTTALVVITVENVNDEPPLFVNLPDRIIVSELTPVRETITTIVTSDPDVGASLSVSIEPPAPAQFLLTSVSGVLSVLLPLDAETPPREFPITLSVTDSNTDPRYEAAQVTYANTTIVIQDANDIFPQFSAEEYSAVVTENRAMGTFVLNVSATDRDYGLDPDGNSNGNNRLTYLFDGQNGPPANTFMIDSATGVITTAQPLNREDSPTYTFTVVVRDNPQTGSPHFDTAIVTIEVEDINEFPPIADPDHYFAFIPESTAIGQQIETYAQIAWNISRKFGPL